MQAGDVLGALRRRWLIATSGLVLTATLALLAGVYVGPTYSAHAVVVLLPPAPADAVDNPYLYLNGLTQARDVVEQSLGSEQFRQRLTRQFPSADYTVAADPLSSGPLLDIDAEASTSMAARRVMDLLVRNAPLTLQSLQDRLKVAERAKIKALTVAADDRPAVVRKSQIRAVIAVTGLGLTVTFLLVALVDGLVTRRRERAAAGSGKSGKARAGVAASRVKDVPSRVNGTATARADGAPARANGAATSRATRGTAARAKGKR